MSTRTRNRKRARSPDNNNTNNKKKKQKTGYELIELAEYFCCVCKELSYDKIFQCPNGCIICPTCYDNLIPCKCPLCRVQMSKNKPIRCRIAERTLSLRVVKCRFNKCNKEIIFSNLNEHENNDCQYKPVKCKFSILGCNWEGLRRKQEEHELQCKCDQNESLKIVKELSEKLERYQKFCRKCTNLHCDSIWISTDDVFDTRGEEFYFEGYEYKIHVKSEKKRIRRNQEIYEIFTKIVFAEEIDQLDDNEIAEVDLGIIIEPHGNGESKFIKESKVAISKENIESEWTSFEQQLSTDEYSTIFRGGFDMKVFCFGVEVL
eukprot:346924_1